MRRRLKFLPRHEAGGVIDSWDVAHPGEGGGGFPWVWALRIIGMIALTMLALYGALSLGHLGTGGTFRLTPPSLTYTMPTPTPVPAPTPIPAPRAAAPLPSPTSRGGAYARAYAPAREATPTPAAPGTVPGLPDVGLAGGR